MACGARRSELEVSRPRLPEVIGSSTASTRWTYFHRETNLNGDMAHAVDERTLKAERTAIGAAPQEATPSRWRIFRSRRFWLVCGAAFAVAGITVLAILIRYFPFSEKNVLESLGETFPSVIGIDRFETVYFPHPGCRAIGVTFRSSARPSNAPPFVTIQTLTIQGSYADFLVRPHYISKAFLEGLRVQVPPLGAAGKFKGGYTDSKITIGELIANGTVLEFARSGNQPALRFDVPELSLRSVSSRRGMNYRVAMRNPVPPGEIHSTGHFGPFHANDPGKTPVSGKISFDGADLGVFGGVAGIVNATGSFSGPLEKVSVEGSTDSRNFEVVRSGHAAPMSTRFRLEVNSMNGDVVLNSVDATYFDTAIHASGSVADKDRWDGKFTSLDLAVRNGRVQDILRLFVSENRPPMSGATSFQAHVTVPPEGKPFLKEVTLQGEFDIASGHFENSSRQESVDNLSANARGDKQAKQDIKKNFPVEEVAANAHSHTQLRDGVATLPDLMFVIPGADARMHGTFDLLSEKIDLHGTVKTDSKFSQNTSGIKAAFAKILDPFLDKKHGSVIPVLVNGTWGKPNFGVDLNPIKK